MRHVLKRSDGFRLFTDHRNLLHVFDPVSRVGSFKHADDRLSRWAVLLLGFRYVVEHIPGEENVVADLLSRWELRLASSEHLQHHFILEV